MHLYEEIIRERSLIRHFLTICSWGNMHTRTFLAEKSFLDFDSNARTKLSARGYPFLQNVTTIVLQHVE